ncbi:hypothetical protein [Streptomyces capitiformicae]|uniref:Uncharacterized protein n=1 Tax=Streptomyces capitiformicae TaxID=2014920 RepID=A0A919GCQ4_9ACTN|nr:hypothetical protein [Streptomyces capitiformicae]GHH82342.1 hypothetical protein GCM10017771_06260 [Streptomyces capitiformicae]
MRTHAPRTRSVPKAFVTTAVGSALILGALAEPSWSAPDVAAKYPGRLRRPRTHPGPQQRQHGERQHLHQVGHVRHVQRVARHGAGPNKLTWKNCEKATIVNKGDNSRL